MTVKVSATGPCLLKHSVATPKYVRIGRKENEANYRKHGVAFEDILIIFELADSAGLIVEDKRQDYGEDRFILLCPFIGKIYYVTFTWRADRIRLISARRANSKEVAVYERRKHD